MFYQILPTKIFRKDSSLLTYSSSTPLIRGQIVLIPLGKKILPGIVISQVKSVNFPTKPIHSLISSKPLPEHLLSGIFWLSQYYLTPLPLLANLLLPRGITKNRRKTIKTISASTVVPPSVLLNSSQLTVLNQIKNYPPGTKLLHGVTGSGKTHLYIDLALEQIQAGRSVILLVPEIGLTSQLVQIFEQFFYSKVKVMHSNLSESLRHQAWLEILSSDQPQIIIGPRSALLSPISNLGLIIIDEAHDPAYHQDTSPRYSALRLASFFAQNLRINCILGTATPLISDYHLAKTHKSLFTLDQKAKSSIPPKVQVIDLKDHSKFKTSRFFADSLLSEISKNLQNQQQTLIFHNRRGTAPLTFCQNCGWQSLCPKCLLPLTLHSDHYRLICHTCGYSNPVPSSCPNCHHPEIIHKGFGTKLLETEITKLFPTARVVRFDTDKPKSSNLEQLYPSIQRGDFDIIIGTQSVAKGLDLPKLHTVAVIQADSGLSLPDYTTEEKIFQLLTQVIGRVGRGHQSTSSVFIQTFTPESPIIKFSIQSDYSSFYQYLIKKRHQQLFPPFSYLAQISITYKTETTTLKHLKKLRSELLSSVKNLSSPISISYPTPAFHEHSTSGQTWQLLIKSPSRQAIQDLLAKIINVNSHLQISLDPPSLLN